MLLRDPVHGLIEFGAEHEAIVKALLDTKEVQRLRQVRQMGLASLVFPGAEHSRFAHAVGTAHVMVRLQQRVLASQQSLPAEQRIDAESSADAVAAALLHDLGHGPFSHLFEELNPKAPRHEQRTATAILAPDTEVHHALERFSTGMSQRVAALLQGTHRLRYLGRSLSGMLDVDRCDYLLRDSHMSGVRYGLYDLEWLLRGLTIAAVPGEQGDEYSLVIDGRKGLPPIEEFFVGRHFMYQQVYHHKAVRAADALMRGMFQRLSELVRDGAVISELPGALRDAALGKTVEIGAYLELDDPRLLACMAVWEHHTDAELRRFARHFRGRVLPKTMPLPATGGDLERQWQQAYDTAREVASRRGWRPDLHVWLDVASHHAYEEQPEPLGTGLWVRIRHQPMARLGDVSTFLKELRNKAIVRPRLIFPAECRDEIVAAIGPMSPET